MPKLGWGNASVELFGRIYFKTSDIFVGILSLKENWIKIREPQIRSLKLTSSPVIEVSYFQ